MDKLTKANFIHKVQYPNWLADIIPIQKKNGQFCIWVDFTDLNNVYPKDDFLPSIIKLLVDAITRFGILSFMDGFSGNNQVKMDLKDEDLTAIQTPQGIYCYIVMPFS